MKQTQVTEVGKLQQPAFDLSGADQFASLTMTASQAKDMQISPSGSKSKPATVPPEASAEDDYADDKFELASDSRKTPSRAPKTPTPIDDPV